MSSGQSSYPVQLKQTCLNFIALERRESSETSNVGSVSYGAERRKVSVQIKC